jgi:hypothetical protein
LKRRAYLIFLQSLGPQHPNTQTLQNNYTALLQAMGRSQEEITAALRRMAPELFQG